MSKIVDTFFGGAEKQAAQQQVAASRDAQNFLRQGIEQGTQAVNEMFPLAQQQAQQGFQGALDVFQQTLPQQAQAFQGGNVAAQQQLLAGLPQIQNAILGNQIDLSGLQPFQQAMPDFSFANQRLPQVQQGPVAPLGLNNTPPINLLGGRRF